MMDRQTAGCVRLGVWNKSNGRQKSSKSKHAIFSCYFFLTFLVIFHQKIYSTIWKVSKEWCINYFILPDISVVKFQVVKFPKWELDVLLLSLSSSPSKVICHLRCTTEHVPKRRSPLPNHMTFSCNLLSCILDGAL